MSTPQRMYDPKTERPITAVFHAGSIAAQLPAMAGEGFADTAMLMLMSSCENRCFFCANPGTTENLHPTPWARIAGFLEGNRTLKVKRLLIAGTEPTTHPDLIRAAMLAQEVGFTEIQLMTSGMRLSDPDLLTPLVNAGLQSVCVPLYAAQPAIHNAITGTERFSDVIDGLDAAHRHGVTVHIHTLALYETLPELPALVSFVSHRYNTQVRVGAVREKTMFPYDQRVPSYAEIRSAVADLDVILPGFPRCLDRRKPVWDDTVTALYFRSQAAEHPPACMDCADREGCLGVVRAALKRDGPGMVIPR